MRGPSSRLPPDGLVAGGLLDVGDQGFVVELVDVGGDGWFLGDQL